nr:transcriptional regulator [Actinomycetota bacterium]
THRPAVPSAPAGSDDRDRHRGAAREQALATAPGPASANRLAEILAENGVSPSTGGRRRHRYRDESEPDDVLARVLGQS